MPLKPKRGKYHPQEGHYPSDRIVAVPAPIGRRILAFIIDILIASIFLTFPFKNLLKRLIPADADYSLINTAIGSNIPLAKTILLIAFFSGLITLLYFAILEYKLGFTIGKMFMGLRVVAEEGAELSLWRCIIRSLIVIPVFPFVIFWVLDPLYLLMSSTHQRLLEKWSSTKTIAYVIV